MVDESMKSSKKFKTRASALGLFHFYFLDIMAVFGEACMFIVSKYAKGEFFMVM